MTPHPHIERACRIFGCTPEQARAQYRRNARSLAALARLAERTGDHRHGTPEYLRRASREYAGIARS